MTIVQENNWKINNILTQLTNKHYFRIFKTDLYSECDQFESGRIEQCNNPKCSVKQCDMRDVPLEVLEVEKRHQECTQSQHVDQTVTIELDKANTPNPMGKDWLVQDEKDMVYIDQAKNPSGWTGQTGNTANNLWLEIHSICANTDSDTCAEDDILRRLISGMHSNTNMHIAANQPLEQDHFTGEISRYGFNQDLQLQFFPHQEWIENMYFTQIFLLKSIGTIKHYLESAECTVCPTDADTINLLNAVMNNDLLQSCTMNIQDAKDYFKNAITTGMIANLKTKFNKIARIINCTECEKCRLHAKQELVAIGTALKIDFNMDKDFKSITRNELVALINTAKKFSDSIQNQWIINENLKNQYSYSVKSFNKSKKKRVLIIGSGLAGLSAAYHLSMHSQFEVILIDKNNTQGGNSAKATSGINGVQTSTQSKMKVDDSVDQFVRDTMKSNTQDENEPLVREMAQRSGQAIETLKKIGVKLDQISRLGGHSASRTHRIQEGPVGWTIVNAFHEKLKSKIKILKMTKGTAMTKELTNDNQYVFTTSVQSKFLDGNNIGQIQSDYVIFATGGFSASKSKLKLQSPQQQDQPTTNGSFATGDGIDLGAQLGGVAQQTEQVQIHPTGFVDPFDEHNQVKWLAPEALRGTGGLLFNADGHRFCNELGTRDQITEQIEKQKGSVQIVLNDSAVDKFGPNFKFQFTVRKFFNKYDSYLDFGEKLETNLDNLKSNLLEYSHHQNTKTDDKFGKNHFETDFGLENNLQVAKITPVIHQTMGGLKINTKGIMLDENNNKITNAYAIGEVSGGVHGKNRLAGNSLLECMVQGQIAAEDIVDNLSKDQKNDL